MHIERNIPFIHQGQGHHALHEFDRRPPMTHVSLFTTHVQVAQKTTRRRTCYGPACAIDLAIGLLNFIFSD